MSAEPAIQTDHLTKSYAGHAAVDDLSITVAAGTITGFVGRNGAGKTTTLRMLLGLISPTAGAATILGQDLAHPGAYLTQVGALIEGPAFHPTLSARQNLRLLTKVGSIPSRRIEQVLETVDLADRADDSFRSYSLGMKQRLGIAAALLPEPALLVLDEPTNGLDPQGIAEMRVLLERLCASGATVFVSSHLLAEIQQICEHLIVIDAGQLRYQGPLRGLTNTTGPHLLVAGEFPGSSHQLVNLYRAHGIDADTCDVDSVRVAADPSRGAELNHLAATVGVTLSRIEVVQRSLESAVLELTNSSRGTNR